jgi:hypothetical protein
MCLVFLLSRHSTECPSLALLPQAEAGEVVLKVLEKSGLIRTQQGAALMLTVHGYETEVKIEDIGRMSRIDLANLYTVNRNSPKASPMLCNGISTHYASCVCPVYHPWGFQTLHDSCQVICVIIKLMLQSELPTP